MVKLYVGLANINLFPLASNEYFKINPMPLTYETIDKLEVYQWRITTAPGQKNMRIGEWIDDRYIIDNGSQTLRDCAIIVVEGYRENIYANTPIRFATIEDLRLIRESIAVEEPKGSKPTYHRCGRHGSNLRRHMKSNADYRLRREIDHFKLARNEYCCKFNKINRHSANKDLFDGEFWRWHAPTTASWKNTKCRYQWQRHNNL